MIRENEFVKHPKSGNLTAVKLFEEHAGTESRVNPHIPVRTSNIAVHPLHTNQKEPVKEEVAKRVAETLHQYGEQLRAIPGHEKLHLRPTVSIAEHNHPDGTFQVITVTTRVQGEHSGGAQLPPEAAKLVLHAHRAARAKATAVLARFQQSAP